MIQESRIQPLNGKAVNARGSYVLYWMQQSQRAECNHALEYAVDRANGLDLPVVVFFGITGSFPEANARHYAFMLEGLRETRAALERRGILFVPRLADPAEGAARLSRHAALVVTDRGYLRVQREWRARAAERAACLAVQVESDVVVPVETASPREEYSAATFRPKITRLLFDYLRPLRRRRCRRTSLGLRIPAADIDDTDAVMRRLGVDRSVPPVGRMRGGAAAAKRLLGRFIAERLDRYDERRNDPGEDWQSCMGPYLHFGQISPLHVALRVLAARSPAGDRYLEELIVRRELAMNFVHYHHAYDRYECLPEWARATLRRHGRDRRPYRYTLQELERAATHDPCWNAAQREMLVTGKMHGYMRMYWGKKILEWSAGPEDAFGAALFLNNRYSLDGRDPNGFAGVAWCFGKHDRPWGERAIFGTVRYMNDAGLRRKFDMEGYLRRVPSDRP